MHLKIAATAAVLLVTLAGATVSTSCAATEGPTAPLDTVSFGNIASEALHGVSADSSEVVTGGLGQSARRLLPLNPVSYKGGTLTFTVKVDPAKLNYITFKFWGSDKGAAAGRLMLFCGDKQIGYRDQGDYDIVNQLEDLPLYPGRFVYTTLPLPPQITNGKTSVALTLEPIGWIFQYGTSFEQRQKPLKDPSRGIYAAYSSTSAYFAPPVGEAQGVAPVVSVRPTPGPEILDAVRKRVNEFAKYVSADPKRADTPEGAKQLGNVMFLAQAYKTPWCSVHNDPKALEKIVQIGDGNAIAQSNDPKFVAGGWLGAGPLGWAVMRVYPELQAAGVLDQTIALAGGKAEPRREAWADTLRASVDYWQANRRCYSNQSMIIDTYIYAANEGARLLDPSKALPNARVLSYLYQAAGIEPWLGSVKDAVPGTAVSPDGITYTAEFGRHYHDVSSKGLSKELGYVAGYGETAVHWMSDIVRITGDAKLRDQAAKLAKSRGYFRYPLPDGDGYRSMVLESIIDSRNGHYPGDVAYTAGHGSRESEPMEIAALTLDPTLIGFAQQELADNQYFDLLAYRIKAWDPSAMQGLLNAVDDYDIISKHPKSNYKLPMTDGQPDFVFSDEDAAVVALKHGDRRLYFNFYYRAESAINGVVRIHDMTPQVERIVTARSQFEYTPSGHEYIRPDWIDTMRGVGNPPPGETVHQAWAGEKMPVQARPADAPFPEYSTNWGSFVGKADFYSLVYGDYIVGLNTNATKSYKLNVPKGVKSAIDLTTGKKVSTSRPIDVGPKSTVVLSIGR